MFSQYLKFDNEFISENQLPIQIGISLNGNIFLELFYQDWI